MFRQICLTLSLFVILFSINCKSLTKNELVTVEAQHLQQRLKNGSFMEIYESASFCMKQNYSEEQFVVAVNEAVDKLKTVDENLIFWSHEDIERDLGENKFVIIKAYGVGWNWRQNDYDSPKSQTGTNRQTAVVLTSWQEENRQMKLGSFQVLLTENEEMNWYGTSSCKTTFKEVTVKNGETITKTTFLTDPLK